MGTRIRPCARCAVTIHSVLWGCLQFVRDGMGNLYLNPAGDIDLVYDVILKLASVKTVRIAWVVGRVGGYQNALRIFLFT